MKKLNEQQSLERLEKKIKNVKNMLEKSITERVIDGSTTNKNGEPYKSGHEAKQSLIRSQKLIYELHEFVKEEYVYYGVDVNQIEPGIKKNKPEIKVSGYFKQKDQDVCVVPKIKNTEEIINWGTTAGKRKKHLYGKYKEERVLMTNIRSQLSSVNKNIDTLFERMITESLNIHLQYPNAVVGELYMIPVYEYDDKEMVDDKIAFKKKSTDIEKFIEFFSFLNNYNKEKKEESYKYTKCALVIVDFNKNNPKIYLNNDDLINDNLISKDFELKIEDLSPITFIYNLLCEYEKEFNIEDII